MSNKFCKSCKKYYIGHNCPGCAKTKKAPVFSQKTCLVRDCPLGGSLNYGSGWLCVYHSQNQADPITKWIRKNFDQISASRTDPLVNEAPVFKEGEILQGKY